MKSLFVEFRWDWSFLRSEKSNKFCRSNENVNICNSIKLIFFIIDFLQIQIWNYHNCLFHICIYFYSFLSSRYSVRHLDLFLHDRHFFKATPISLQEKGDAKMSLEDAIRVIQTHERARQGRVRALMMREIINQEKRLKQRETESKTSKDDSEAAVIIQKVQRHRNFFPLWNQTFPVYIYLITYLLFMFPLVSKVILV